MRTWLAGLLAATMLVGCSGVDDMRTSAVDAVPGVMNGAVRIETGEGLGSGVHIGNGLVITAAHVVKSARYVAVVDEHGAGTTGEVVWTNTAYDIAAVRYEASAPRDYLACVSPKQGETVIAIGNPVGLQFITMRGYVAGVEREVGPWKTALLVDMTAISGMSGGPVYGASGDVIGITVGTLNAGNGQGGMGIVVPGHIVCELMGRVV